MSALALLLLIAFIWGFSEATFFFIVPDVIISLVALTYGWRAGGLGVLAAIAGAVAGGVATYFWGKTDIDRARAFFDLLPAIAPATILRASQEVMAPDFGLAMLKGSLTGVPYKLYASEAGANELSLLHFVMLTPVVRFPRFAFAAILAAIAHRFAPPIFAAHKLKLLTLFWVVF